MAGPGKDSASGPSHDDRISALAVQLIVALACLSLSLGWAVFSWAPWAGVAVLASSLASIISFQRLDRALGRPQASPSAIPAADLEGMTENPTTVRVPVLAPAE